MAESKNCRFGNIMDSEFRGREPARRSHGEVVGATIMDSELFCKIVE